MTVSSAFTTETATMNVAAQRVNDVADAVEAELRALDNRIQPITSSWRGAAASAYLALHARWTLDARELRTVLGEISQALTQNATRYQTTEDDVAAQMTRVSSTL